MYVDDGRGEPCIDAGRDENVKGERGGPVGVMMPKPIPSPVGVEGRGVGALDFILGVLGRGFSLQDSPLLSLILCISVGFSPDALENLYGAHVIGRSLNLPRR